MIVLFDVYTYVVYNILILVYDYLNTIAKNPYVFYSMVFGVARLYWVILEILITVRNRRFLDFYNIQFVYPDGIMCLT